MLKFEHFWKCLSEKYPPPLQISKYATAAAYICLSSIGMSLIAERLTLCVTGEQWHKYASLVIYQPSSPGRPACRTESIIDLTDSFRCNNQGQYCSIFYRFLHFIDFCSEPRTAADIGDNVDCDRCHKHWPLYLLYTNLDIGIGDGGRGGGTWPPKFRENIFRALIM